MTCNMLMNHHTMTVSSTFISKQTSLLLCYILAQYINDKETQTADAFLEVLFNVPNILSPVTKKKW